MEHSFQTTCSVSISQLLRNLQHKARYECKVRPLASAMPESLFHSRRVVEELHYDPSEAGDAMAMPIDDPLLKRAHPSKQGPMSTMLTIASLSS